MIKSTNNIIDPNLVHNSIDASLRIEKCAKDVTTQLGALEPTGDYLTQIERRLDYLTQLLPLDDVLNLDSTPLYSDWKKQTAHNLFEFVSRPFRSLEVSIAQSRLLSRVEADPIEIIWLYDKIVSFLPLLSVFFSCSPVFLAVARLPPNCSYKRD